MSSSTITSVLSQGPSPKTQHLSSYTVSFKVHAVEWLRQHGRNVSAAAREFSVDRKRIQEWDTQYHTLLQRNVGNDKKNLGRPPVSDAVDKRVFEYLEEERSEGRAVSNLMLIAKAREVSLGLQLEGFRASPMWLSGWKRYAMEFRASTNCSQKVPVDYEDKLQQFRKVIIRTRKAKNIDPKDIINMDQTMVRFDMPSRHTNEIRGKKTVRVKTTGAQKKGFTVALAATASGGKLPAYIIFKEQGGVLCVRVKRALTFPSNVRVRATTNGWMTKEKYHQWLRIVYSKHDHQRLLIIDNYKPHLAADSMTIAEEECNSEIVVVPGGCTGLAQPMDKSVNKPFKEMIRGYWAEWMRLPRAKTAAGNLKQPTRQDVIDWVSRAWDSLSVGVLKHSFLVCALDGSEDHLVSEDIPAVDTEEDEDGEVNEDSDADDLDYFEDIDEDN